MSQVERPMIIFGTAGEHIACADLIMSGYRAFLTAAGLPYDLVLDAGGRLLRVAVKASTRARPRPGCVVRRNCYQFNVSRRGKTRYTREDADLIAFVALDRRLVGYLAVHESPTILHLDEPGTTSYEGAKRPGAVGGRKFEDFPLVAALARAGA